MGALGRVEDRQFLAGSLGALVAVFIAARQQRIAHCLLEAGGHYVAARSFGPVEYRAVAICKQDHHAKPGVAR